MGRLWQNSRTVSRCLCGHRGHSWICSCFFGSAFQERAFLVGDDMNIGITLCLTDDRSEGNEILNQRYVGAVDIEFTV